MDKTAVAILVAVLIPQIQTIWNSYRKKNYKRNIKEIKKKRADPDDQDSDGAKEEDYDAGYQFGGRNSKKSNKKKKITWMESIHGWMWIITKVVQYL